MSEETTANMHGLGTPEAFATGPQYQQDTSPGNDAGVEVQAADFPVVHSEANSQPGPDLNRFHDVQVSVSAELGRTRLPIQKLLQLGVGSIIELNRSINGPVELIAQGVPLASGEVVVVNDCFAIRIREIYPGQVSEVKGKK
jgi:flagellar motor switch protein FliN/FliY